MPRLAAAAVSRIGRTRWHGRLNDGVPGRLALAEKFVDLRHQDHRIANDDADKGKHAEQRHKAERRVEASKRHDDADKTERRDADDERKLAETLQLNHQQKRHDEQHHRRDGRDRPLRLGVFLDRPAGRERKARRAAPWRKRRSTALTA